MRLLLPIDIAARLGAAIRRAGRREIGGILMGEHIKEDEFKVIDVTIQMHGGTLATFIRIVNEFIQPLQRFFDRTGHNYQRFNYLGEWHSHPSFDLVPSPKDGRTMREIIDDPEVGANFVILLLLRSKDQSIEGSVTVYPANGLRYPGEFILLQ